METAIGRISEGAREETEVARRSSAPSSASPAPADAAVAQIFISSAMTTGDDDAAPTLEYSDDMAELELIGSDEEAPMPIGGNNCRRRSPRARCSK